MSELVFATIAKEIKSAFKKRISNPDLIMVLYDSVAVPVGLKNKNKDVIVINKGTASKIMNRQKGGEIREDIRMHSQDEQVTAGIKRYIEGFVFIHFLPGKDVQLLKNLIEIISNDNSMNQEAQAYLLSLAKKETLAEFVGRSLLYSFSVPNVPEQENTSDASNKLQVSADSGFTTRLLLESSGICANDNCNKPLSITKGEDYQHYLECVVIDSTLPQDSFENNIAFCPECAAKFRMRTAANEIQRVKEIKKRLMQDTADRQMLSESQVTDGVKRVIQKISDSLTEEPEVKLSYDPVTVEQKLLSISKPLCIKVKSFVTAYYNRLVRKP